MWDLDEGALYQLATREPELVFSKMRSPTRTNLKVSPRLSESSQQGDSVAYARMTKSRRLQGIYPGESMELPCVGPTADL